MQRKQYAETKNNNNIHNILHSVYVCIDAPLFLFNSSLVHPFNSSLVHPFLDSHFS